MDGNGEASSVQIAAWMQQMERENRALKQRLAEVSNAHEMLMLWCMMALKKYGGGAWTLGKADEDALERKDGAMPLGLDQEPLGPADEPRVRLSLRYPPEAGEGGPRGLVQP
jgi:hypothetical protein